MKRMTVFLPILVYFATFSSCGSDEPGQYTEQLSEDFADYTDIHKRSVTQSKKNNDNSNANFTGNDSSIGNHSNDSNDHSRKSHGIHVASWNYEYVEEPFIIALFLLVAGISKLGFHHTDFLSSIVPESCLSHEEKVFPIYLTPRLFFLFLLPPIILESAYSLHDRVFFDNVGTVLLFAVIGTVLNCFIIGPALYLLAEIGAMGQIDINFVQCLVFSSLVVAVDPVAVLAIFQEIGVNNVLYFLVFGESLLNDAVTVVLYNMMKEFNVMDEITAAQVILGIAAFFTVSLGGLFVGLLFGILTAVITKYTVHVRVVEPLAVFVLAYMSFIAAEMFHFSGIISMIGCGLTQANYAFRNISQKSATTVKYFSKMQSATSDCVIFLFLGMTLFRSHLVWHTGFTLWTLLLCLVVRFLVVFFLTFIANKVNRLKKIDLEEQFIMAYGGLRGAVCFSLVDLLDPATLPQRDMFVTTTLVVVFFTVFVQGTTIKPLVRFFRIRLKEQQTLCIYEEINVHVTDHVMAGIEEVLGRKGQYFWREILEYYDDKYLRNIFQRTPSKTDEKIMDMFEKIALRQHFENLSSSKFPEKYASSMLLFNEDDRGSLDSEYIKEHTSAEDLGPDNVEDDEIEIYEKGRRRSRAFSLLPAIVAAEKRRESRPFLKQHTRPEATWSDDVKLKEPKVIDNPTVEDVRKMLAKNPANLLHQEKTNKNIKREESTDILQLIQEKQARTRRMSMCIGQNYDGIFQGALLQTRREEEELSPRRMSHLQASSFDDEVLGKKLERSHSSATPSDAEQLFAKRARFQRAVTTGHPTSPYLKDSDDRSPLLERTKVAFDTPSSKPTVVEFHEDFKNPLQHSQEEIEKSLPKGPKSPDHKGRKDRERIRKWRHGRLSKAQTYDIAEPLLEDIVETDNIPLEVIGEATQPEEKDSQTSQIPPGSKVRDNGGRLGDVPHVIDMPSSADSDVSIARNRSYVDAVALGGEDISPENQETKDKV